MSNLLYINYELIHDPYKILIKLEIDKWNIINFSIINLVQIHSIHPFTIPNY